MHDAAGSLVGRGHCLLASLAVATTTAGRDNGPEQILWTGKSRGCSERRITISGLSGETAVEGCLEMVFLGLLGEMSFGVLGNTRGSRNSEKSLLLFYQE